MDSGNQDPGSYVGTLGEVMRNAREKAGLKQRVVSSKLQERGIACSISTLSRLESGKRISNLGEALPALCEILNLDKEKMLNLRKDPSGLSRELLLQVRMALPGLPASGRVPKHLLEALLKLECPTHEHLALLLQVNAMLGGNLSFETAVSLLKDTLPRTGSATV